MHACMGLENMKGTRNLAACRLSQITLLRPRCPGPSVRNKLNCVVLSCFMGRRSRVARRRIFLWCAAGE